MCTFTVCVGFRVSRAAAGIAWQLINVRARADKGRKFVLRKRVRGKKSKYVKKKCSCNSKKICHHVMNRNFACTLAHGEREGGCGNISAEESREGLADKGDMVIDASL